MRDISIINLNESGAVLPNVGTFSAFSGKNALAQRIVKLLLTAKGSDFFNLELGTTLLNLYGVYSNNSLESIKTIIPILIKDFVENIKREQDKDLMKGIVYENSELLEDIIIKDIKFDPTYSGWIIDLEIINKTQDIIKISVP